MEEWKNERRASFNNTGRRGHCRIKEGNKKTEGGKGGEDECHQRQGERRAERPRLLEKVHRDGGMEGVMERVNRGGSKSSGGCRGREMAAMNK